MVTYAGQKCKKKIGGGGGGSPTSFRKKQARKSTVNLKNQALLTNKATMSVSPKIMQLDLWSEMFSAKYCLSGPIKWI